MIYTVLPEFGTSRYQARYSSLTRRLASSTSRLRIGFTARTAPAVRAAADDAIFTPTNTSRAHIRSARLLVELSHAGSAVLPPTGRMWAAPRPEIALYTALMYTRLRIYHIFTVMTSNSI